MKTKEELNALKKEVETLNKKLAKLTIVCLPGEANPASLFFCMKSGKVKCQSALEGSCMPTLLQ